jgi:hypothetical protein
MILITILLTYSSPCTISRMLIASNAIVCIIVVTSIRTPLAAAVHVLFMSSVSVLCLETCQACLFHRRNSVSCVSFSFAFSYVSQVLQYSQNSLSSVPLESISRNRSHLQPEYGQACRCSKQTISDRILEKRSPCWRPSDPR